MEQPISAQYMEASFTVLFRYAILAILFVASLLYIYTPSIQYLMFIVVLTLVIFGGIFVLRDVFSTDLYVEIAKSNFLMLALFALIIGVCSLFISLAIIVSVFDYARKGKMDFITRQMSMHNQRLLNNYKYILSSVLVLIPVLCMILVMYYTKDNSLRRILNYISVSVIASLILALTGYQIYLSAEFYKVKAHANELYYAINDK